MRKKTIIFKRFCRQCNLLYQPYGRAQKFCDDCKEINKQKSIIKRILLHKNRNANKTQKSITRGLPRACRLCSNIFQPIGKYQKLCEKCYKIRFKLRNSKFPTKNFKEAISKSIKSNDFKAYKDNTKNE